MKKLLFIGLIMATILSAQKRPMTVEDMWNMKRVGDVALSADESTIAFTVTQYSMEENKGNTDIYLIDADGKNLRPFKNSEVTESQPVFTPCGKLAFIKGGQLHLANLDGTEEQKLTDVYSGVSGIQMFGEGKILFTSMVYPDLKTQEENKARDESKEASKVKASLFTELFYRHWNDWRGEKRNHLFVLDLKSKKLIDLNLLSTFDAPPIALASGADYTVSPDGKEIAFAMNEDKMIATSTNNDIFIIKVADIKAGEKAPHKKISISKGGDTQPVYSPDGKYIAYTSMERAGFEADKHRIMLYNRETGKTVNLFENVDFSAGQILWTPDSKALYYTANNEIYNSIFKIDIDSKENSIVKKEIVASNLILTEDGEKLFFKAQESTLPYEIFSMDVDGDNLTQITEMNAELLAQIEFNPVETFWSKGANGGKVQSMLIKPPHFDPNKEYPLIHLIHGGPQGHWDNNFHYRWNSQMFAAPGYVVIATNPTGSTGYGQEFTDAISGDWGGAPYKDLMNALDYALEEFDYIDDTKVFAAGASYGGYMINWIAGHTDRYTALVSHAGLFNLESFYGETEELWFPEWDLGGTPYDNAEAYDKFSPHKFVNNIKTPMLVVHGAYDFRISETQAFELFTALQRKGVESQFLYYPDETHFVVKPQNAKLWWKTVFNWFDKYK